MAVISRAMAVGYGASVRLLLLLLAACGSTAATAVDATPDSPPLETHALSMNDVSILLPLPADPATPVMMSLNGIAQPLVPSKLFLSLVTLAMVAPKVPSPIGFGDFQVVALRFDLCDRSTVGVCPTGVDGRLRLILQPMYTSGGVTLANDLAVHTFFPIPAADTPAVVNELRALARIQDAPADAPLGVSPAAMANFTPRTTRPSARSRAPIHASSVALAGRPRHRRSRSAWRTTPPRC
jgi:hypothetical protein